MAKGGHSSKTKWTDVFTGFHSIETRRILFRLHVDSQRRIAMAEGGPSSRTKWTDREEMWLVVNCMWNRTPRWLQENIPGGNNRSENAVNGHLNDMRLRQRLPRAWRAQKWTDAPEWTLDEDTEALLWHLGKRKFIDCLVFMPNNRPGKAVRLRANYLAKDVCLLTKIEKLDGILHNLCAEYDAASADDSRVPSERLTTMGSELRQVEDRAVDEIHQYIRESLNSRTDVFCPHDHRDSE